MNPRAVPALLGVLTLLALPGCAIPGSSSATQSYEIAEPVQRLVVNAEAGQVEVTSGDGPVRVTETVHYRTDKPRTTHSVEGGTLRLAGTGCADRELPCHIEIEARVPSGTVVDVTTEAGEVRLRDLAGAVTVTTQAGAVEGTSLSSERVSVTTEAGAASLQFVAPPTDVQAATELGAIVVKVPRGVAYAVQVDAEVGSADVRVDQDRSSTHKISARTQVGGVRVEHA